MWIDLALFLRHNGDSGVCSCIACFRGLSEQYVSCTVWMGLALFLRYNGDSDVCSCIACSRGLSEQNVYSVDGFGFVFEIQRR